MSQKLTESLTLTGGTGINLSNSGIEWDGSETLVQSVDVGNDISITGNVQFNSVTASSYDLSGYTLRANRWTTNFTAAGNLNVSGNITIPGNVTIGGKITAEEFIAELTSSSTIFKSGSTRFGDDIGDSHQVTGSVYISGSFNLLGTNITEFSNDISLGGESSTALATESSSLAYATNELGGSGAATATDLYLRKNYNKIASVVSNNTASFNAALTASSPDGITSTSEDDFMFFNNGQVMEHDALQIQQSRGTFYLIADSDNLGYNLSSDDDIKAWGKFESKGEKPKWTRPGHKIERNEEAKAKSKY